MWCDFKRYAPDGQSWRETGGEGWEWLLWAKAEPNSDCDGEVLLPRSWRNPRFGSSRRGFPVVGVSWWEASAYCRWLQRSWQELPEARYNPEITQLDLVRLPVEFEWEAAAGGRLPDDRFPWDRPGSITSAEREIIERANTGESRILHTTPVWMYPTGASEPWKIMDMGGNVLEWQGNDYGVKERNPALRGGSWDEPSGSAPASPLVSGTIRITGTTSSVFGLWLCPWPLFPETCFLCSVGIGFWGRGFAPSPGL